MTLRQAFLDQSKTCAHMGSPLMGRVFGILAERWDPDTALGQKIAEYQGDIGPAGHSLPLRIGGGLHALVLRGQDAGLMQAYPPNTVDDATLENAILNALKTKEDFFLDWTRHAPQTNEVRRSAALIPMAHVALSHFDRPIVLSELGASGGLNLMWDHFALATPTRRFGPEDAVLTLNPNWTGKAPPQGCPQVMERSGVDLNPLNLSDNTDRMALLSYLWADQPHRVELTHAATSVLTAKVDRGDAIDWLEHRLTTAPKGHMHMIQHTVAWQYFPAEAQARGTAMIEAAGVDATPETPLAWMQMETDGDTTGAVGAALTLRLWPGDITVNLGRADFHGRWIKWAA
ncbi:DUF2332 domain-containing protein [Tateyamaria omphalii]|uniref:DUF2332 domain-containing protein n=1 Tax=Tateyamaria omphalii TaxID=299262 RepID=A0A1P8MS42_9RHOB|nr:DUF2332 family protein [Tateyamaria omphalii]APX10868.1 hypothetical protein BWR18_03545 [Tateyamaria omphalii]